MNEADAGTLPERPAYLAMLALAPAIWMAHFLMSYLTAAIWCAKVAGRGAPLDAVHTTVAWYTVLAVIAIALVGWSGYARHRHGLEVAEHDSDTPADRHRFLGFATMLLAGLSAVATLCVAVSAMWFETCH
jgi:hypothetical protein